MKTMQKLIATVALLITVMSCFAFSIIAAQIKPSNLTSLTASQSANSVTLSWSKSKNATGYRIFRKVKGKWKKIKTTSATKYTVKKLKKDTKYTFAVRPYAKNDKETVWAKKYKSVSVYTSDFIGTIKKVKATQKNDNITLSWDTAENAKGYRIYERLNGKWKKLKTTHATKYTIENPKVGKHTYAVRPYTKFEGKTVWAKYTKASIVINPAQVTKLKATATDESVVLKWNKVAGAKYAIFSYNSNTGKYTCLGKTTKTSYTVSNLNPNTTYKYAVQAYLTVNKTEYWGKVSDVITIKTKKPDYFIGINGEKVYTDENGWQYYLNDLGNKVGYITIDSDIVISNDCSVCGKSSCQRVWDGYYCKICQKDIPGMTCHPKSHYEKSK